MLNHLRQHASYIFFLGMIIAIFISSVLFQNSIFINHDVAWLAEAARRLLLGGTYTNDFFENNPPMILYLYVPPVLLSKIFSLNIVVAMRLYVYFIAALSLFICYDLIKKIFAARHEILSRYMLVMLAIIFLIVPLYYFAQREHLLVLLIMPYIFLMAYQLEGKTVTRSYVILIGVMAGLGFAIKPYFIFSLLFIELYYLYCQKSWLAFMRPDFQAIMLVMVTYLSLVFLVNPDYVFTVIPFALHFCHFEAILPVSLILSINSVYFIGVALVFYLIQRHANPYKKLMSVLVLATLGFLLSYIVQFVNFKYHINPALSFALLLATFLYGYLVTCGNPDKVLLSFLWVFVAALAVLEYQTSFFKEFLFSFPALVFAYFGLMFASALYFNAAKSGSYPTIKIIISVLILSVLSYLFALGSKGLFNDRFMMIMIFTFISFSLLVNKLVARKSETLLMAALGITLFVLPISYLYVSSFIIKKTQIGSLLSFMQENTVDKTIYFISTGNDSFPTVNYYGNGIPVSRFSSLWMLGALVKQAHYDKNSDPVLNTKGKYFLAQMLADDLNSKKPAYVFVDVKKVKFDLYTVDEISPAKYKYTPIDFNYISYFSANKNFAHAWNSYRYVTTLPMDKTENYVAVYKREV